MQGSSIKPSLYENSFLDYAWNKYNLTAISAHVSCCNFPKRRQLLTAWKTNMAPLLKVLSRVHQGVWGVVYDSDNKPVVGALVNIDGRPFTTDKQGKYLAVMPEGSFKLEVIAGGHKVANVVFTVQLDLMTRQNVFLQSVSTSRLVYHTAAQKQMSLASLETQYPDLVKVGSEGAFVMARIAQNLARHVKPPIMVVGGDGLGAELAYNLAVHFVTRFRRDDLVTRVLESFDLYVGYNGLEEGGRSNTTGTCGQGEMAGGWLEGLRMHEEKFGCLLRIGLQGGSTAVLTSPGPQAR